MAAKLWKPLAIIVLLLLIALASIPASKAFGREANVFGALTAKAETDRIAAYKKMTFQVKDWAVGTVYSRQPYSVVSRIDASAEGTFYELQIWRGTGARIGDDLLTYWDVLELSGSGKTLNVFADFTRVIRNYFAAASQTEFQSDAANYPRANIPTDAEADTAGKQAIPADAGIDSYGIAPKSDDGRKTIKPAPLSGAPGNVQGSALDVPKDIAKHWAKAHILELMQASVIQGYEDGTIRPNGKLTKAEFAAMLVRAIGLPLEESDGSFSDMKGNWAAEEAAALKKAGAIGAGEKAFNPNRPITRLEMARIMDAFLKEYAGSSKPAFKDLKSISKEDQAVILKAASLDILSGDPDGKFRPSDTLTRGEASKVIVLLLHLTKGGNGNAKES